MKLEDAEYELLYKKLLQFDIASITNNKTV